LCLTFTAYKPINKYLHRLRFSGVSAERRLDDLPEVLNSPSTTALFQNKQLDKRTTVEMFPESVINDLKLLSPRTPRLPSQNVVMDDNYPLSSSIPREELVDKVMSNIYEVSDLINEVTINNPDLAERFNVLTSELRNEMSSEANEGFSNNSFVESVESESSRSINQVNTNENILIQQEKEDLLQGIKDLPNYDTSDESYGHKAIGYIGSLSNVE
jgi:hypothetical protein